MEDLLNNYKELNSVRKLLVEAIKDNSIITRAGEWLIDNFYLIEEQIRTAKKYLSKKYDEALPQLIADVTQPLFFIFI